MKLAIISDIHSNLHALEAVLADIERRGADQVIVNGDMVNRGPDNVAVMERLAARGDLLLLGNHEDLVRMWIERDPEIPSDWFGDPFWDGTAWSARQLEAGGWIETLRRLPMVHRVALPEAPTLLLSHGSPRHYREGYGAFLTDEQIAEIVQLHPEDILIGSHTHRSMEREWGRHTLLNTGAVGAPFNGDPRAQYLLLTLRAGHWTWEFCTVDYDRDAALAAYETSGYLREGGLSALIFQEELRLARSILTPYWSWTETRGLATGWESWRRFREEHASHFVSTNH
ncbi:MAG: metallophosphoesterase family protein [Geodermatophilaceae bacterium]|nr:metallophosphoesterase family protein [Geodermatophilaceae bacterium]